MPTNFLVPELEFVLGETQRPDAKRALASNLICMHFFKNFDFNAIY